MSAKDLAGRIDELAAETVMADPHDLQAAGRIIESFGWIAENAAGKDAELIVRAAKKAAAMAEDMIVQPPDEAAATLEVLGKTVTALMSAAGKTGADARELLPPELGIELPAADQPAGGKRDDAVMDEVILAEFLSDQVPVIEELEEIIMSVDRDGMSGELCASLRRIIHTMKGEAGMLGLDEIQRVCHETETFIDNAVGDSCEDCPVDKLLAVKDWLASTFETYRKQGQVPVNAGEAIESLVCAGECGEGRESAEESSKPAYEPRGLVLEDADPGLLQDFIVESRSHLDNADVQLLAIENEPEDKEALNNLFRSFHTIKGGAGFLDLQDISALSHVAEDLLDRARKGTLVLSGAAVDVVFETVDTLRRLLDEVEAVLAGGEPAAPDAELPALFERLELALHGRLEQRSAAKPVQPGRKLGEILVDSGAASADQIEEALSGGGKLGESLVKNGKVKARAVAEALRAQKQSRSAPAAGGGVKVRETIKIDTERLDRLLDAIGELVITESMVSQDPELRRGIGHRVTRNLRQLHKITRGVQELGMSMRMVAIRPTFQKMARLVRDLARKSGKQVEFVTSGEETELDRSVVERINDPLIHLVRNAIDHGIEPDGQARIDAGKPAAARVELKAFHRGGNIYIEISDDGRGLDRDVILAKAREKGVVADGSELSDKEVFNLIFAPGFSTAKQVTDVSGRGVGMDVVKRNIQSLRGNIELFSERGKGTTVSMQLPLTLAIIDGLIVQVGEERYIAPTLSVLESLRPSPQDISTLRGRGEMLSVRGSLLPLYRIGRLFDVPGARTEPHQALVMIVESHGKRAALMVDQLLGQQQVVIKNLGRGLARVPGISGGAIMADGLVGLILDIGEIVKLATTRNNGNHPASAGPAEELAAGAAG